MPPHLCVPADAVALEGRLRAALCSGGSADEGCESAAPLAAGAVHCITRAAALARVALGAAHPLAESNAFAAFFAGLPYPVAAAISQAASELGNRCDPG